MIVSINLQVGLSHGAHCFALIHTGEPDVLNTDLPALTSGRLYLLGVKLEQDRRTDVSVYSTG